MTSFEKLIEVMNGCGEDAYKAYAGNKSATKRVRAAMMEVKKLAQEVRVEMVKCRE